MRAIDTVLNRIERPMKRADGGWLVRCCAHEDRSPSLSITERDDGVVLLHCFAGCSALDVLDSLGLEMADLYPTPLTTEESTQSRKYKHNPADLLRILDHEANIIALAAAIIGDGGDLSEENLAEVMQAREKIERCRDAI